MISLIKSTFYKEKETKKSLLKFISKSQILSFNKECEKFEENFSIYQNRKHSIFVNSGSSANLALIQALLNLKRLNKGEKIGFSALTWSTNVMPLIQLGLKPIPIDIELDTLNVSSKNLVNVLKKNKIKALFLSNILGFCDDIDEIVRVCKKENIILLEDNCESLGTVYKRKKLGNFGLASTFSFYVGHHLSTIEGGMVCTDNEELADMLSLVRAHGWDRNLGFSKQRNLRDKFKINSTFYSRYTFYDLGYNLRPTEINGFLGNNQLNYIDEIIKKRRDNFIQLAKVIYKNPNYYPIRFDHLDLVSNFAFPIICKTKKVRDELVKKCDSKIEIRPIVGGDISSQPFFKKYISRKSNLRNVSLVHNTGLYFGNNPEITNKEISTLINFFKL